jgi:hypothetical protein
MPLNPKGMRTSQRLPGLDLRAADDQVFGHETTPQGGDQNPDGGQALPSDLR